MMNRIFSRKIRLTQQQEGGCNVLHLVAVDDNDNDDRFIHDSYVRVIYVGMYHTYDRMKYVIISPYDVRTIRSINTD
jgi:hypothetical protein